VECDPNLGTFKTTGLAMEQGAHRLGIETTFFNANKGIEEQEQLAI
jgi:hypothetical protein